MEEKVYKGFKNILVLIIPFVMVGCFSSCVDGRKMPDKYEIFCGAEQITVDGKKLIADNDSSFLIGGANHRTEKVSRTGNYSLLTNKKAKFTFATTIPIAGPDYYFKVSVWRKASNSDANLVVSSSRTKDFYKKTSDAVEKDENGWEKLQLEFYLPPNIKAQEIKVNIWNSGDEDAYFDDLSVIALKKKEFPQFEGEKLYLEIDTSKYIKLQQIRRRAFDAGLLQSTNDDWVKGFIFSNNKTIKSKLRLKGDWLDHQNGEKWSFRLKLKGDNSWKRMKVFSVQSPMARMGISEWFLHQIYMKEGVLTTRYDFIPFNFKGRNLGIYAYEEHFVKQLLESQDRREGPIIRFLEDAMWDTRVFNEEGERNYKNTPYFEAAAIKPFSPSKIIEDSIKLLQFEIAQNLMCQFKSRTALTSEVFNIDMLARFYALSDVFYARHSLIWHNLRFYYNPVLCKLEPIAFDCFSDIGLGEMSGRKIWGNINNHSRYSTRDEYLMLRELFNDTLFVDRYIECLTMYSNKEYLNEVSSLFMREAMYRDSLLAKEYIDYAFDTTEFFINAEHIRDELSSFKHNLKLRKKKNHIWENISIVNHKYDTVLDDSFLKNLVHCYRESFDNDSIRYIVKNFFPKDIIILGFGKNNNNIDNFIVPYRKISSFNSNQDKMMLTTTAAELNYLFLTRDGGDEIISVEIFQWQEPKNKPSPLQELINDYPFKLISDLYVIEENDILFNQGQLKISDPLIIPRGYVVKINGNTKLDLVDSSMIISFSPVEIKGDSENPVVISSPDFSAMGFTILQADRRSVVNNVVFENLNTLNYKGWTLTGAVNFYESNVDITNTVFYRNQCEDALNIIRSEFSLTESKFDFTFGDAFDSDFSNGIVDNTLFTNIGNDAIDFSGSLITITDTRIIGAVDKGISGGENSKLLVDNIYISKSNIGLASKDLSEVIVSNSLVEDCNYGLVLLQKKPEFGPSTMKLVNTKLDNLKYPFLIELNSTAIVDNDTIKGIEENLGERFY